MLDVLVGHLPRSLLPGDVSIGPVEVLKDFLVLVHAPPFHLSADRNNTNFEKTLEPERVFSSVASEFTVGSVVGRRGGDHNSTLVGRGILDCAITVFRPAFLNACPSG